MNLLQRIILTILQALLLAVMIIPAGIAVYKLLDWAHKDDAAVVMDPDQDEYEFQQQQQNDKN